MRVSIRFKSKRFIPLRIQLSAFHWISTDQLSESVLESDIVRLELLTLVLVCVWKGGWRGVGIGKASNSYFSYSVWLQSILSIKTSAQKECQRVILYPVNWFSHCCRIISLKFFACFLCNYILSNLLWTRCALYRDCRLLGLHTVYAMHLLPLPLSNCKLKTIYRTRKTRCAFRMMRTFQS